MTTPSRPARIGLVGAGWRAEFFLRVARALPGHFTIARVLVRSTRSATSVTEEWGVAATTDIAEFERDTFDYVVVSAPAAAAGELVARFASAGLAVLTETPPAVDVAALLSLWRLVGGARVQVAEQYHLQPHHAARLRVAADGRIGEVTSARVSTAHGYHGVSLARRALGAGLPDVGASPAGLGGVRITAREVGDRMASSRGREGWKETLVEVANRRTIALLEFETGQSAVFDFAEEQYWSPVRSRHFSIHGTLGEIDDDDVRYLAGPGRPVHARLERSATGIAGDLGGMFLEGIALHGEPVYENRFGTARLNDDELAVAEAMHRMARFAETGEEFYGLAEASHDHYLGILVAEAAASGTEVASGAMPWA